MPRVLRIINRLNLGGPTYNAAYLSKYLSSDYETLLVSGMKDEAEESSEFIVKQLGLTPVYLPDMYRELNPFKDFRTYRELRKIIDKFKPDIVHTHAAKAGAVGRLAASHAGVKGIVHTFHGHVFHSYFGKSKTKLFIKIEQYLARRTHKIITLSEKQKKDLTEKYRIAPPDKFVIIPLGFDLRRFTENQAWKRKTFREQYGLDDTTMAVGIIGRLVPVKNHRLFLNAIKEVTKLYNGKVRAFLIGDGELRQELEDYCRLLGLCFNNDDVKENNPVTFCGWRKDVDVCLAGLDVVALTSNNEGTPVSLIEAQAAGKPIVSTNVGGIEDVVSKSDYVRLSPPGNTKEFTKNLLSVIDAVANNRLQGSTFVSEILNKYSYERLCRDMENLYNTILNR
ncbi:MAG: glycosyltransferase [Chitinophagales bacterium]|nr:glycosyltransferase [Chitinophagales bacterium]MDW8417912.1 glycosyltransferase [Chitinophagales bacterium]